MVKIEQKICIALDFNLTVVTSRFDNSIRFLFLSPVLFFSWDAFFWNFGKILISKPCGSVSCKVVQLIYRVFDICVRYILEHIIMDSECVGFKSSLKASIALYITFVVTPMHFILSYMFHSTLSICRLCAASSSFFDLPHTSL